MKNYWLLKTEPTTYSIDDLARQKRTDWEGVRNYQARNFMRDGMKKGDLALFYHSNSHPSGVAGICRISKESHPDVTALDPKSPYYDPKAAQEDPIWMLVEVEFVKKFSRIISIEEMRQTKGLESMILLKKGSRLSVMPMTLEHFEIICALA